MSNLLESIINISESSTRELLDFYQSKNRANNMGESFEKYIKDAFIGDFNLSEKDAIAEYEKIFSYLGNQNNPPDIMLRKGDAFEIKKLESPVSSIALNSSFPKDKLRSNSPMITEECRKCEGWEEKDLIYIIGHVKNNNLKYIWFVSGDLYAAGENTYTRIKDSISNGINEIPDIEFSETKELGRVNRVDPLGITYLRIRGMWGIENPNKVFEYIDSYDKEKEFQLFALISESKFNSFPESSKQRLKESSNCSILNVKVKNPNNPSKLIDCILIRNIF